MNAPQENAAAPKPKVNGKKGGPPVPLLIVGAILLIGGIGLGGRMWWRSQHLVETDNAFVAGRLHPVATRVAGVVTEMRMQDNAVVKAGASAAKEAVVAAESARQSANAQKGATQALLKDAQNQLGYVELKAASDGRIGKRTVEVGQRVQPGQQLAAIVEPEVWITANFKETQLSRMKPGQKVHVKVDAFPGKELEAHVDSFAPASGASFALLPPDNATGNFTKIVQRIPVKIVFDDDSLNGLLRSGMSVEPDIDTKLTIMGGK